MTRVNFLWPLDAAPRAQRDFGPLVEGCPCYACQRHTRAYVHHLLMAEEMLGLALLSL